MPEYPKEYDIDDGDFSDDYADEIEIAERLSRPYGWRVQFVQMLNSEQYE